MLNKHCCGCRKYRQKLRALSQILLVGLGIRPFRSAPSQHWVPFKFSSIRCLVLGRVRHRNATLESKKQRKFHRVYILIQMMQKNRTRCLEIKHLNVLLDLQDSSPVLDLANTRHINLYIIRECTSYKLFTAVLSSAHDISSCD